MTPACVMATLIIAGSTVLMPRTSAAQVRDAAVVVVLRGNASVTGSVVADTPERPPLRRATITLSRIGVEDIRTTSTDDQGRFVFGELPAGSFTLSASKGGYIGMSYGAPKPGMPGQPVVVAESSVYSASPIALIRGAVLGGRLLDRTGAPVAGATIEAVQFVTIAGERRRRVTTGAAPRIVTNDHGEYRIHGLPPGDYLVQAPTPPTARLDVSAAEIAWATQPGAQQPPPSRAHAYGTTLFPGVGSEGAATPITLRAGEERLGLDFSLQYVPLSRITGVVTEPSGGPAARVTVQRSARVPGDIVPTFGDAVQTLADGTFTMPNVPAGEWVLTTRGGPPQGAPADAAAARAAALASMGIGPASGLSWWGMSDVSTTGADVSGLTISMQPAMSFSGQFVTKGSALPPEPSRLRVTFGPATPGAGVPRGLLATADAEGRFRVDGVIPGRYRLSVQAPGPVWSVRSAILDDRDIIDAPFDVRAGQHITGVTITLTDSPAELSGRLTDASARPMQLYVLVFSADRSLWGTATRRVASARARETGDYSFNGLPPGEYFLCALTEIDTTRVSADPAYLEELAPLSIKLSIGEGEKKRQDLRVGG